MRQAMAWFERTRGRSVWRRVSAAAATPYIAGVLLGSVAVLEIVVNADTFESNQSVALLLSIGATVPLMFVRSQYLVATGAVVIAALVMVASYHRVPIAALVALFAIVFVLGRRRPRWMALVAIAPFVLFAMAAILSGSRAADAGEAVEIGGREPALVSGESAPDQPDSTDDELFPLVVAAVAAAAAGLGVASKTRIEAAERSASHQVVAEALVENAALGERSRIARELHDVVAHHISMISVQAETARLATPNMPPEGAERLQDIGDTARTALAEMRRLLGVLREDVDAAPPRAPQPGLPQLVELVDEARQLSTASTRLIVQGRVHSVDPGIGLAAYRIVQEALTNARRHAPGAAVDVELHYQDDSLRLRIRDNGPGPRLDLDDVRSAAGHGLLGMRERIVATGGDLRLGVAPGGGFLVEATLPVGVTDQAAAAIVKTVE